MKVFLKLLLISCFLFFSNLIIASVDIIHISTKNPLCNSSSDGYVTIDSLTTTAPTGPYRIRINTQPSQTFNVGDTIFLTGGAYTITIKDFGDPGVLFDAQEFFTLTPPFALDAQAAAAAAICFDSCNGSVQARGQGGTKPYTFLWDDPNNTMFVSNNISSVTNLCDGRYNVTITDANGCTDSTHTTVTEPTIILPTVTTDSVDCNGNSTGIATANPSGGSNVFIDFSWSSSGNNTSTETGLPAGFHTVTVTDNKNCIGVQTFQIFEPADLTVNPTKTNANCFNDPSGSIDINPSGGTPNYDYLWDDGNTSGPIRNGLIGSPAGITYSYTVTDSKGCSKPGSQTVFSPTEISSDSTTIDVTCKDDMDGSITFTASGGTTGIFTFVWSDGIPTSTDNSAPFESTVNGLDGNKFYYVTIFDNAGCTKIDSAFVFEPDSVIPFFSDTTHLSCFNSADGSLTASANGGTTNYTFNWSDGTMNNPTATGLSANITYTVTVIDANGCSNTISTSLNQPSQISPNIAIDSVDCNGTATGSATAAPTGGSGNYSYEWSSSANTAITENALSAGVTYTVTVTDGNNCTGTESFQVLEPTDLIVNPTNTNASCFNDPSGSIDVNPSGGTPSYAYLWDDGNTSGPIRNGLLGSPSGITYLFTVTDSKGCTEPGSRTIFSPTELSSDSTTIDVTCKGDMDGSITFTASGGTTGIFTFVWSDGIPTTTDNSAPFESTANGLDGNQFYYVTIFDNAGCTKLDSAFVFEPDSLIPFFSDTTHLSCFNSADGSLTASANGGTTNYTFNWSDGTMNNPTATGLSANITYTVTVIDANGCSNTISTSLNQPSRILPNIATDSVNCNSTATGSATASPSGGSGNYSYEWSSSANTAITENGLSAGVTYTVTVTDGNNCTGTESFQVLEPTVLTLNPTKVDAPCFNDPSGSINIDPNGGTPSYAYLWNDGNTSGPIRTGLIGSPAGITYLFTVTDSKGCPESGSQTIFSPTEIVVDSIVDSVSCKNELDGAITFIVSGGTVGPLTFNWSTGFDTIINDPFPVSSMVTGLAGNNTYYVTITNSAGCLITDSAFVVEPDLLVIDPPVKVDPLCNGSADGTITINVSGGTPGYDFLWNDGNTDQNRTLLPAGNYSVVVTDLNGCTNSIATTLINPPTLQVSIDFIDSVSCNGLSDGSITAIATGGDGNYTYTWVGGPSSAVYPNRPAGTYTVNVVDGNGCPASVSGTVEEPDPLVPNATQVQSAQCAGVDNGQVTANPTGGTSPYTYAWNPGNIQSKDLSNLSGGSYTVTITDNNGCTSSETVIVQQPDAITFDLDSTLLLCNGDMSGTASVINLIGGTGAYTFNWSPAPGGLSGQTATGLSAQNYDVTVFDANGCSGIGSIGITEPSALSATITSSANPTCNGINNGTATATATGGTIATDYTYSWAPDGETTNMISGKGAGTHICTITDDNNCSTTASITFINPPSVIITLDSTSNVGCFGGNDGYIEVIASQGTAPYTYDWDNINPSVDDGPINAGLAIGLYTVTITDFNGCQNSQSFNITQPAAAFAVNIVEVKAPCFNADDGSLTVTESNGTAPYTYTWTGTTQTTDTVTGIAAGFQQVTVIDSNGCSATNFIVLAPSTIIVGFTTAEIDPVACFGDTTGTAGAVAFGGTPPLVFNWSNGTSTGVPSENRDLKAGTYTVTVIDDNLCQLTSSVVITEPSLLIPNTTFTNESCTGNLDGKIISIPTGGSQPYTFEWSNNIGNQTIGLSDSIIALTAGTYTLTLTDDNNCDTIHEVLISTSPTNFAFRDSLVNERCNGDCDGYIEIKDFIGSIGQETYLWSNGSTNSFIDNLCAGPYDVRISDINGCDTTVFFTILPGTLILSNLDRIGSTCGATNGQASVTPTNGTAPYTFEWSINIGNPPIIGTTDTIKNLAGGSYDVTITESGGCSITEPFTIGSSNNLTINAVQVNISDLPNGCFGDCTGKIAVRSIIGGTMPYTFTWNNVVDIDSIENICAGVYNLIVEDFNGCTATQSFTITEPSQIDPNTIFTNSSCTGNPDGKIISNPIGGTSASGNYTFEWSNNIGNINIGLSDSIVSLLAGTYTLTVSDDNGCDSIHEVIITTSPTNYTFRDSLVNESCNGDCDGYIEIKDFAGSIGQETYLWSNGSTNGFIDNLCAGPYDVRISDINGCDTIVFFTILPGTLITSNLNKTDASCGVSNGQAFATPSGGVAPYTFEWSADPLNPRVGTTDTIKNLAGGNYDVTITESGGCSTTEQFSIGSTNSLTIATIQVNVDETPNACFGDCTGKIAVRNIIGGTMPYTFTWTNNGIGTIGIDSIVSICAGAYDLRVEDANGCFAIQSFTISEPSQIDPILAITNTNCSGNSDGKAISNPIGGTSISGNYTFEWSTNIGNQTIGISDSITSLTAGTYTVTVSDENGCDTVQTFNILGGSTLFSYTDTLGQISCDGVCDGLIEVRNFSGGTPQYTFTWNDIGVAGANRSALCSGTYTVIVNDANGCDTTITYNITPLNPIIPNISIINDTCLAGKGTITAMPTGGVGPYTYQWQAGIGVINNNVVSNVTSDTYTVVITDNNGCFVNDTIDVNNFSTIIITPTIDSVSCFGGNDGSIFISVIGSPGSGQVTYDWKDFGKSGPFIDKLRAGFYEITVTDDLGCAEDTNIQVSQPANLEPVINTIGESCNPGGDGIASALVFGGTPPYTFEWNGGSLTADTSISNLSSGLYSVKVIDSKGCDTTVEYEIFPIPPFFVSESLENESCDGGMNGFIQVTVTGAIPPVTFLWDNGHNGSDRFNLAKGTYRLTITDGNMCPDVKVYAINKDNPFQTTIDVTDETCGLGNDGIAKLTVTDGVEPYTYNWFIGTGSAIQDSAFNLTVGSYSVSITDDVGCTSIASFRVNSGSDLDAGVTLVAPSCISSLNGSIILNPSGGDGGPYSYQWAGNATLSNTRTGLGAGIYRVTISDNATPPCTKASAFVLRDPDPITATPFFVNPEGCNPTNNGGVSLFNIRGGTPFSNDPKYTLTSPAGQVAGTNVGQLSSGTYLITITDSLGCTGTQQVVVTKSQPTVLTGTVIQDATCFGGNDGQILISTSGGADPLTFEWSDPNLAGANPVNSFAGTFTVTVTDGKGCASETTVVVDEGQEIDPTLTFTGESCSPGNDGSVTVTSINGTGPFTYDWGDIRGNTSDVFNVNLTQGNYSVTITDNLGCTKIVPYIIEKDAPFTVTDNNVGITCNGAGNGIIDLTVTGNSGTLSYNWIPVLPNSGNHLSLPPNTYRVTITDLTTGCEETATYDFTDPDELTATFITYNESCNPANDGRAKISVQGGTVLNDYTYAWNTAGGGTVFNDSIADLTAGNNYSITVTDDNSCTKEFFYDIDPASNFTLTNTKVDANCNGNNTGIINLSITGGSNQMQVVWTDITQPLLTRSNLPAATYIVNVTDLVTNCTQSNTITIANPPLLTATVNTNSENCNPGLDGNAKVIASGGTVAADYTYQWPLGIGTVFNDSIDGLTAGPYEVTVFDDNGCEFRAPFVIDVVNPFTIDLDSVDVSCIAKLDGSASVTASSVNVIFEWSNSLKTSTITNLSAGTYSVTATDTISGCSEVKSIVVNNPVPISVTFSRIPESCTPGSDGEVRVATISGGTGPYMYDWGNGITSDDFNTNLIAGNYLVTIMDNVNCPIIEAYTIESNAPFDIDLDSIDVTCNGLSNGKAYITPSVSGLNYLWSNGFNTDTISNLSAGPYSVTVTDPVTGCSESGTIEVNEPALITPIIAETPESCNPGNDGEANVTSISGGVSPYTYDWGIGITNDAFNLGLKTGSYTVTVIDASTCSITQTYNIGTNAPFLVQLDSIDVSCNGGLDGAVTSIVSIPGVDYLWSFMGSTASFIDPVPAGTYTVTVTDRISGCSEIASISVNEPDPIQVTVNTDPESCSPGIDGKAKVFTINGGTPPYTYDWGNGLGITLVDSALNLTGGAYSLEVFDNKGCSILMPYFINNDAPFNVDLDSVDVTCFGGLDGKAYATVSITGVTYQWSTSPVQSTDTAFNLTAGTYSVVITDPISGCSETQSIEVLQPDDFNYNVATIPESCVPGNDGRAVITGITGGTNPYTFDWGKGITSDNFNDGLVAGPYSVIILDAAGCSKTENYSISVNAQFAMSLDSIDVSCNGLSDGKAYITPSVSGLVYLWSNGFNTDTISNLTLGTYSITVTDPATGCIKVDSIQVNEPSNLSLTLSKTDESCSPGNDGSATAAVSGGTIAVGSDYTYLWSNGSGNFEITNQSAGTYSVTVTDDNNCSVIGSIIINPGSQIVANEIVVNEQCFTNCDGSITLNPTGGSGSYSYEWDTGEIDKDRLNLCSGTYTVTIKDGGNCDLISTFTVNPALAFNVSSNTTDLTCSSLTVCNGSAYVTAVGGAVPYTYNWPAGTILGLSSDTAKNLCVGTFNVTVFDNNGCSVEEQIIINGPPPITASFNIVNPDCQSSNGSVTITASGGSSTNYTYQWFDVNLNPIGNTTTIAPIASGIYFVDVTDDSGCTIRFIVTVSDQNAELVTLSGTDASCFSNCDGTVTAQFNCQDPACTIQWFDAATGNSLNITTRTISNLCAGTYIVEVTNNSGCKSIEQITISGPSDLIINNNVSDVSCFNGFDGRIELLVGGGSGSYLYNWAPGPLTGQGTNTISGIKSGQYFVTITDNNCDTTLSFQVGEPQDLSATFTYVNATCGQADGIINSVVSGGTVSSGYSLQWLDALSNPIIGQTNQIITGINAGIYFLRVTDNNLCEKTFTATLGNTNGPIVTIDSTLNVTCFDDNDGAIYTSATGANSPFTYNWLPNGETTDDITGLKTGSYILGVSNSIGCLVFDTVTISGPNQIIASINTEEASCGLCNGTARVSATGGTGAYTYLWSNGSTADSAEALCGGVYSLIISDSLGCSETVNFNVNTNGGPTGQTVSVTSASCQSNCDGSATVTPVGGIAPYTYLWIHNGATTRTLNNMCPGNYILQVSDVKGCSRLVNVEIQSPAELSIQSNIVAQTCNSNPCDGSIRVDVTGGTKPYDYSWDGSFPNSNSINDLCAGIYNLTVTDANGCSLFTSLTVSNDGIQLPNKPTAIDANCFGSCDGSLISNVPLVEYTYQWFNDKGQAIAPASSDLNNSVCAGDYFLEVTSIINGCKVYQNATVNQTDSILLASSVVKNISCHDACDGEIFISTLGGNILYQYSWNDPNGQDGIPAFDLCAGDYTVTATDASGCTATTTVRLSNPDVLSVSFSSIVDLNCSSDCNGSATADVLGGVAPYSYNWDGGQIGQSPTDLCFGANILTITDATGCSLTDTVNLSATDTVVAIVPSQNILCGADSILLDGEILGSSVNSFAWYIGNTSTLFTTKLDTTISRPIGDYVFYLIASNGSCSDTTEYKVKVATLPLIGLASSIAIFKDEVALFKVSGQDVSYSYLWSPEADLNDSKIAEPLASPRETRVYTLSVTDTNNCTYQDSINVIYTKEFEIPSGISPNGDGVNDTWEIDFLEDFPKASVMVYNRWGELLFEQNNGYNTLWDGTYDGQALPIGTYYYIIDLKSNRFDPFTGPITIIK